MVGWVNIRKEDKEELIEKLGKGEKGLVNLCYLSKFYLLTNCPTYLLDLNSERLVKLNIGYCENTLSTHGGK
jgi:hypothetical protein